MAARSVPDSLYPSTDDSDDARFCGARAFFGDCVAVGCGSPGLLELQRMAEHLGPFRAGAHIFRTGDPFRAIYAVRRGIVKTFVVDRDGRKQVLRFFLPGEVIGLNAIHPEHFPCNAVTLDATWLCRFPFPAIRILASRIPAVQKHLFRMLSKELGSASLLASDHSADQRVAAFLMDLTSRYAAHGFSGTRLHLSMSRGDIANHLRLATETVSRAFSHFRVQKLIQIEGRELRVLNPTGLREIAGHFSPDDAAVR